jgi:hypothetical protein
MVMLISKPFHFILAMLIACGLFLSPFSVKPSFSSVNATQSTLFPCLGMGHVENNKDKMSHHAKSGTDSHHKHSGQDKRLGQDKHSGHCCISACSAFLNPVFENFLALHRVKSELIMRDTPVFYGKTIDGFARPPKALA